MNVACSSATFALEMAYNAVRTGACRAVLVVNPEITSAHLAWKDRDCHFIFGDVCTAILVEPVGPGPVGAFEVLGTRLQTSFSNAIATIPASCRAPKTATPTPTNSSARRSARIQSLPMAAEHIASHLAAKLVPTQMRRFWLHQTELSDESVRGARKLLGRDVNATKAPIILDRFANTASAGSIIAFHRNKADFKRAASWASSARSVRASPSAAPSCAAPETIASGQGARWANFLYPRCAHRHGLGALLGSRLKPANS